jgi:hypothetical protein
VDETKKQDLQDVMRSETRRGKRPVDIDERRRRTELQRDFKFLLDEGSRDEFVRAIRALGLQSGSPQFEQALSIWDETRGSRK